MENFVFKCKGCGNDLESRNAANGIVECEYCGMARTVPKQETKPAALSYLMLAEHDLEVCAFDNAFTGFKKAAEVDGNEPEAYFGMALARFNVQYLKDLSGQKMRLQPICHEISDKKFCADENYIKALEKATSSQRAEYERKGKEIDYIRGEFRKLQEQGLDYDCFLCVKVTDDSTGLRTKDYKRADDIYFNLRKKGYKPFFSERELDNVTGADYEARILYALYSSECMIVVCGNENYLQTPWVKNEYTRFLKLIRDEEKESDSIAIAWFSSPIEKLSGKRGKIQGINLDALDASERITAFVENHTPQAKLRREEEKRRKEREAEEQRRKLEAQERAQRELLEQQRKLAEEQQKARQELEERQKMMEERLKTVSAPNPVQGVSADANAILFRAKQEAEFGDFSTAAQYYQRTIDIAPQVGEGWWGAFLCKYKTVDENSIIPNLSVSEIEQIRKDKNYIFATRNATNELKDRISAFAKGLDERESFLKDEERKRKKEEERIAREKAEAEKKQKEEKERIAREKAEAERRIREKWKNDPTVDDYDPAEFEISNKILRKYKGNKKVVKIPRGVISIGAKAFSGCSSLLSVTIPDGVLIIEDYAFNYCKWLKGVAIPDSVTSIGEHAFCHCSSLESINIPQGVTGIGDSAFSGCSGLTSVTIPKSVTSIGWGAFRGCNGLTSVAIPNGVTSIGRGAFDCCIKLKSVTIPNSVTSIGDSAFMDCSGLTNISIPSSVTSIGDSAFMDCSGLTNITIPNGVTSIGVGAFNGCSGLTSITIPNSVTSIGDSAFYDCRGLTSITIPNSVANIGDGAFRGCSRLTSVTIPDGVTSIGESAFEGCSGLTSVTIGNGVMSIGEYAFGGCSELKSVTIPKYCKRSVKNIFVNCKKIKFTFTK